MISKDLRVFGKFFISFNVKKNFDFAFEKPIILSFQELLEN